MDSHDPSPRPANAPQLFAFEQPSCEDFTFIPLSVRFHLDRCGWRLSLVQWQALPYPDRVALAAFAVPDLPAAGLIADQDRHAALGADSPARDADLAPDAPSEAFEAYLSDRAAHHLSEAVERIAPLQPMPGDDTSAVPADVQAQCAFADAPPLADAQWQALSRFQRYALAKLSRKPKANHDFRPALQEFGLL